MDIGTNLRIFGPVMQFQREFSGIVLRAGDLAAPERLVPNPRRSLTEIAEELGFSEPSAFSRWFRSRFGCSPKEWRNRSQSGA